MFKTLKYFTLAALGLWLLASCGSDVPYLGPEPERPAIPQYPSLSFLDSVGFITTDAFVMHSDTFFLKIKGTKGDSLLQTLEIETNNEPIDPARVMVNGVQATSSAIDILNEDRDNFVWDIAILAQAERSKAIYQLTLKDETGRTDILDILINTKINNFTPPIIFVSGKSADTVLTDQKVSFDFEVDAIGAPLKEITVYQGSEIVAADRLKFDGNDFGTNPYILEEADRRGFEKPIEIQTDFAHGTQGYTVAILDSLDNEFFQEVSVTALRRVDSLDIMLSNGLALDLNTGNQDSLVTKESELVDDGVDKSGEWRQTISGVNTASLKIIKDTLLIDFDLIIDETQLNTVSAPAVNFLVLRQDTIMNPIDSTLTILEIKEPIEIGNYLIAQGENNVYLMEVTDIVNEEYTFKIKY